MRFTLATPGAPTDLGQAPASYAPPVQSQPATATTTEPASTRRDTGTRPPPRESRLQTFLLVGVAAVSLAAVAVAIWYKLTHKAEELTSDSATVFKDKNWSFEPPPSPWTRDDEMRVTLGSPYILAYKREDPNRENPAAYMAFGAKDYGNREPRPSELRSALTEALAKVIDNTTFATSSLEDASWLGHEVKGFHFLSQLKSGAMVEGEAYSTSYKGIGYWFLAWSGQNNLYAEQQAAFAEARTRCKLLDFRKDWRPNQSNVVAYKNNVVGYTILDADGLWEDIRDEEDLKARDPAADRMLIRKVGKRGNLQKEGTLAIYIRPATADPMTEAREFVTEKRIAEMKAASDDYKVQFKDRTGTPEGDPTGNTVDATSPVVRLQSTVANAIGQNRLHVISAAKIGDKVVVVHAWCDLADRETFETMFVQIAGSLHASN